MIGTMASNQLLGRPVFDNVIRNGVVAAMGVFAAAEAVPAMLEATASIETAASWGFSSSAAGSATTVIIGRLDETRRFTGRPGFVVLNIPYGIYHFLNALSPDAWRLVNYSWLRYWALRGVSFDAVSPMAGKMLNGEGQATGFSCEIMWLAQTGILGSGRFSW
jgi:hypothetical protein